MGNAVYPELAKVPRWHFWLARLFGQRFESNDQGCTLIGYWWGGRLYITSQSKPLVSD